MIVREVTTIKMAYRFRKRFKIAPGLHLNASSSGLGFSVGPRGASVSVGPTGTYLNTKVPGLPLYERKKLSGPARPQSSQRSSSSDYDDLVYVRDLIASNQCVARVDSDTGEIVLEGKSGIRLAANHAQVAWRHAGAEILEQVDRAVAAKNQSEQSLGRLHEEIPAPFRAPAYTPKLFDGEPPRNPTLKSYHWFLKLFSGHRRDIDQQNDASLVAFNAEQDAYEASRQAFERREAEAARRYSLRSSDQSDLLEAFLESHLQSLPWPRETSISLEIAGDLKSVFLDVDLPEIEHMPVSTLEVLSTKRIVREKPLGDVARRKLYMAHVHAIGLRIIGECFAHLQQVDKVTFSGFSQRISPKTAAIEDEYLLSTQVDRATWSGIEFANLKQLDPVDAYARFETRRNMTGTGIFKAVVPFKP